MFKHVCDLCEKSLEVSGGVKIAIRCCWGWGLMRDKIRERSKTISLCKMCYETQVPDWFRKEFQPLTSLQDGENYYARYKISCLGC